MYFFFTPNDLEVLQRVYAEQQRTLSWHLEADSTITRGGCLIKTEVSTLDATVESRVGEIVATMLGTRGEVEDDSA